jgi:hypothetical protein
MNYLRKFNRIIFIGGIAAFPGIIKSQNINSSERPKNVLMILVDDLKPNLGCYGDDIAVSPNIDRLASKGIRFDMAYCNQAVSVASRYNLLTGARSTSTGLYDFGKELRDVYPNAVTLPQFFMNAGYHTEAIGKVFHVGHGNTNDKVVDEKTVFFYAGTIDEDRLDRANYKIFAEFNGSDTGGVINFFAENEALNFKSNKEASYRIIEEMDAVRPYLKRRYVIINNIDYEYSDYTSVPGSVVEYTVRGSLTLERVINTQIPDEDQAIEW